MISPFQAFHLNFNMEFSSLPSNSYSDLIMQTTVVRSTHYELLERCFLDIPETANDVQDMSVYNTYTTLENNLLFHVIFEVLTAVTMKCSDRNLLPPILEQKMEAVASINSW